MKCLEVRTRDDGIKRRRYLLDDGRRITTLEVPDTVISGLGVKRLAELMAKHHRRQAAAAKRAQIEKRLREGWKPAAIANEVGYAEASVRRIRAQLRSQTTL